MGKRDDVVVHLVPLQSHNRYREKHDVSYFRKHAKVQHLLKQPDVDLQEVTRLVEEMAEHCRQICIDSELAIETVVEELIPSDRDRSILNEMAESMASEQFSDWEREKKSTSSSPALSTSKEDEVSPSIASEEDENVQPWAGSTCSTDESEEKESTATDVVKVPDNQEGKKTEGRWFNSVNNVWRRCTAGIIPPSALGVDGKEESTSTNFDEVESQETDHAADDKPDDSFDTAATVSVASEDLLPTSENTTAPPVVNSVSEDPTVDGGAAAVESAAASEDEEASSAAATEAAAKSTVTSDSEDLTVDISAFDSLINTSGTNLFAETKLPILRLVQANIDLSFKSDKDLYTNIENLASHFVSVLIMHPVLSEIFGAYLRHEYSKDLSALESGVPVFRGFGSIMSSCDAKTSETEDDNQDDEVPKEVIEIKTAIYAAENGNSDIKETIFRKRHGETGASRETIGKEVTDEDVKSFINNEVTNTSAKGHLLMGRQTNSLLMHVLNLYFTAYFLWELSISQLFQYFKNASALIAKLREFAQRANPGVAFDEDIKTILYLETFVAPTLPKKELREAAWEIACLVFDYLNKIDSTGSRNSVETRANDPRKRFFLGLARTFECKTMYGGTDDSAVVFWSDADKTCSERRRRSIRTFAVLFLREAIVGSLEPGFFSDFGFTRCFLRHPPSGMGLCTTFITPTFFAEQEKYGKKFDDIIKKARSKEGEDTGERTLFIQGDEQRKSLRALRDMFVALSPRPAGSRIEV